MKKIPLFTGVSFVSFYFLISLAYDTGMERSQNRAEFVFEVLLSIVEVFFGLIWKLIKSIFSFISSFIHEVGSILFKKAANWVALAVIAIVVVYIQQHTK